MIFMRVLKIFILFVFIFLYILNGFLILKLNSNSIIAKKRLIQNIQFYCRWVIRLFGIQIKVKNKPSLTQNYLLVCNHFGYLDIIILISQIETLFITSIEMREMPLIGLLTQIGACLYVERRKRDQIQNEIQQIENALKDGFNVMLFPEGTSGDGTRLLPFKNSLFLSCANTQAHVLPLVCNYLKMNNSPITSKNKDSVFWYGDISFIRSIIELSKIKSLSVEIEFLSEIEVLPNSDRRNISNQAYQLINQKFLPVIS